MMRAALAQMAATALLCWPMIASLDATQAPKPEPTVTTIVGCLVQGNPSATGNARGETGAPNSNEYFVRTPTIAVPVGTTVAIGKPGTASTATSTGTPTHDSLYRITGMDRAQLSPHVGHRVEVQGHLSPRAPDAAASGVNSVKTTVDKTGRPTTTVETRVDVVGELHATAIKMVEAKCR